MTPTITNLKKAQDAPIPTTKKQVRAFLGLTGFYPDSIPNYARVEAPLTGLTKKRNSNTVVWNS